jgi:protein TonB
MSLAVTAFFYLILFAALFAFGALIPVGGSGPARKAPAAISLRLSAESGARGGSGTGASSKTGKSGENATSAQTSQKTGTSQNPPTVTAHPETSADGHHAAVAQESKVTLVENPGIAGAPDGDTTLNDAGDAAGSGGGMGSGSSIGGTTGGSPAFISWLDSAIRAKLAYPEKARRRNLEGTVTILAEVSADGKYCVASVGQSSGSSILDHAAVAFVKSLFPSPVSPQKTFSGTLRIRYILTREGT